MAVRNIYTMKEYLIREFSEASRALSFGGATRAEFDAWHGRLDAKLRECMGETPDFKDIALEEVGAEDRGDYVRRKVEIRTEKNWWVSAYILVPKAATQQAPRPAILCCHGHGTYGKDSICGVTFGEKERMNEIRMHNYNYAEQMARAGYVTVAPDWRSFGEQVAYNTAPYGGRDKCNVHFISALVMGRALLTLNCWDGWKIIDILTQMPEVAGDRIGCMGLSFGGTMTTYLSASDTRIKAADIICYCTTAMHYVYQNANACGSQLLPQIYKYCDLPDVVGLIAPRPLLLEIGKGDDCFQFEPAMEALGQVKRIYKAAGAEADLHADIFDGGHQYSGAVAPSFFAKYLGEGA